MVLKLATALLLAVAAASESRAPAPILVPAPEDYSRSESVDSSGRLIVVLKRASDGRQLRSTYSALGRLELSEELSAGGAVVDRRVFLSGLFTHEVFQPVHVRIVSRPDRLQPGFLSIERTEWAGGRAKVRRYSVSVRKALACEGLPDPTNMDAAMRLVASPNLIHLFDREALDANFRWLGANIAASNSCGARTDSDGTLDFSAGYQPGGLEGLAGDMQAALRTGLSCLHRLGGARDMDAARLSALLESQSSQMLGLYCGNPGDPVGARAGDPSTPVTISSQAYATALTCDYSDHYPGMMINVQAMATQTPTQRQATLFHETLHLLGYKHSEGVDVAYLAEFCCIDGQGKDREDACDLLKSAGPGGSDWNSVDYQRGFAQLMANNGRASVALDSAWSSVRNDPSYLAPSQPDAGALFASSMKIAMTTFEPGQLLRAAVLARGSLDSMASQYRDGARSGFQSHLLDVYYPVGDGSAGAAANGAKRKLIDAMGAVVSDVIRHDSQAANADLAALANVRDQGCAALSDDERKAVRENLQTSLLTDVNAVAAGNSDGVLMWASLCGASSN